jgi:RNA polymerase sigma-70 factor (ECF subfamily)
MSNKKFSPEDMGLVALEAMADGLEHELVACARGDRQALRRIFDREAGRLVAIAERIVKRRDLAEEVVQEAFIAIWTKAGQYTPDRGSARGWIHAIVRNRALNLLRDGKREDLVDTERLEAMHEADQMEHVLSSFAALDRNSRLRTCLQTLDETRRKGILMAYVGGYSHGEIAGRLRLPLGTAKSWIRRGLAALRECMA